MPHRTSNEAPPAPGTSVRGSTGRSTLLGLLSWSLASRWWRHETPPERESAERDEARKHSTLLGLLSWSAASWQWRRETPPEREFAERDEARKRSLLAGLLSLSALWMPGRREARPRRGAVKEAIMAALVHVDYYEDRDTRRPVDPGTPGSRSVGLSYREIQRRVRAAYPGGGKVSITTIRSYARDIKQDGHAMPYRRPYSARRKTLH